MPDWAYLALSAVVPAASVFAVGQIVGRQWRKQHDAMLVAEKEQFDKAADELIERLRKQNTEHIMRVQALFGRN